MENQMTAHAPQRLAPLRATECEACHRRVYFKFVASVASPDPQFKTVYLRCPSCGHSATRMQEVVEAFPAKARAKKRFKYRA